ncbi:hypothetical protein GGR57DRAFT_123915 [Xylariaceae sp. FL1272]|nr:hypothetical protein GGR57DRAFT_123915 [Xylariaceae sp. FL1272]
MMTATDPGAWKPPKRTMQQDRVSFKRRRLRVRQFGWDSASWPLIRHAQTLAGSGSSKFGTQCGYIGCHSQDTTFAIRYMYAHSPSSVPGLSVPRRNLKDRTRAHRTFESVIAPCQSVARVARPKQHRDNLEPTCLNICPCAAEVLLAVYIRAGNPLRIRVRPYPRAARNGHTRTFRRLNRCFKARHHQACIPVAATRLGPRLWLVSRPSAAEYYRRSRLTAREIVQ